MENNFEDHIKGAMDNPPDFPFDERLWKDMESRLNDGGEKKPILGFIGRLPLLILALLATSLAGYFYLKQDKAMERIADIEQQLQIFQQELQGQNQTKTQTNLERQVTVVYDTIYNKIVVNQITRTEEYNPSQLRQIQERSIPASFNATQNYYGSDRFSFDPGRQIISGTSYPSEMSILNYVLDRTYARGNEKMAFENQNFGEEESLPEVANLDASLQRLPSSPILF